MSPRRVAIRNHSAEANLFARRTFIAFAVVVLVLLLLFANLYTLQVESFEKYQTRSNSNRIKLLPVAPNRGLIYDRNGVLLADNKPVYSLEVIAEDVGDIKTSIEQVSQLLNISADRQNKFFKSMKRKRRFKPVELHSRLSDQQVALFSVNQHKYPGIFVNARLKRYYPFSDLTTHNLGYVARINRKDANKLEQAGKAENYAATYGIGKLGIEKYYEDMLHGTIGHQEVEVNNQGRVIRTLNYTPPVPGKDLTLTLDIELQMIAKRALSGKRGAIVAMDPRTGGILAMYSNPSYDGNLFVHGISTKNYKKLLESKDLPLINRSVQSGYPPASTVKPFLALTGLEENVITPTTEVNDPGWYQLNGLPNKYRDWLPWGHGKVNLTKAIEQSCNIYFYDLAFKLGITKISDMMEKFGFGDYTGLDIHEENKGIMPSVAWKRARYNKSWYTGETLSVGIGQSFWTVTPLQLTQALTTLVNRGERKIPHLLKAKSELIIESSGNAYHQITPIEYEPRAPLKLRNEKNWDTVLNAMHNTVQKFGATAHKPFKGSTYDASGKTGSAQVARRKQGEKYDAKSTSENKRDNAMFIAFAPFEKPEIVIAVAIENVAKGGGATNAAPVARQIMDQYFGDRVITSQLSKIKAKSPTVIAKTSQEAD
ncbi:penicillin-binding protein 2 [Colwellia psychrerythraea]|uniref:Peptidoglycan D,D-transpeptidase MrdA n=1 Tax=Colwellia psychrerythraea TaxID=28229 RepID=A0A099KZV3_COLPS|nr:penicillin-binding protein 2 [Colwellia psychrerythraea]KGJ95133.1 penicillin-binding protein 2 [Colwellia psychrerythraea]